MHKFWKTLELNLFKFLLRPKTIYLRVGSIKPPTPLHRRLKKPARFLSEGKNWCLHLPTPDKLHLDELNNLSFKYHYLNLTYQMNYTIYNTNTSGYTSMQSQIQYRYKQKYLRDHLTNCNRKKETNCRALLAANRTITICLKQVHFRKEEGGAFIVCHQQGKTTNCFYG